MYQPNFIDGDEERKLVDRIQRLEFSPVVLHGVEARRRVIHYGQIYGFESHRLVSGPPIPNFLIPLKNKSAGLMEVDAADVGEALITEYPPGSVIGWHRDAPQFGRVAGVSLLSSCRLRFRRGDGADRTVIKLEIQPRSAYVLRGAARSQWQHSIPAVKSLRYSITFRTVRRKTA